MDLPEPLNDRQIRYHAWTRETVIAQVRRFKDWNGDPAANPFHLRGARLRGLKLREVNFSGMDLRGADFREADLQGCNFSNADASGANFSRCILTAGDEYIGPTFVDRFRLINARGLFGDEAATIGRSTHFTGLAQPIYQAWGVDRWWGDFPSWRTINSLGALPIFAVSNLTLAALIAYGGMAEWYNRQLGALQENLGATPEQMQALVHRLHPIPSPRHLGYLLLILTMLTTASIIYKVACPDIIKEFSSAKWSQEGDDMIRYWSADYSRGWWRRLCGLLYLVFGAWAVWYLLSRLFFAFKFYLLG